MFARCLCGRILLCGRLPPRGSRSDPYRRIPCINVASASPLVPFSVRGAAPRVTLAPALPLCPHSPPMNPAASVRCPVCNAALAAESIEAHVNTCLDAAAVRPSAQAHPVPLPLYHILSDGLCPRCTARGDRCGALGSLALSSAPQTSGAFPQACLIRPAMFAPSLHLLAPRPLTNLPQKPKPASPAAPAPVPVPAAPKLKEAVIIDLGAPAPATTASTGMQHRSIDRSMLYCTLF